MFINELNEKLRGIADFTIYERDMRWHFLQARWHKDGGLELFAAKWTGYDDSNWWINVAPSKRRQKCTGHLGTTVVLEIDFNTDLVVEVETEGDEPCR